MTGLRKVIERVFDEHWSFVRRDPAAPSTRLALAEALVTAIEGEFAIGLLARRVDGTDRSLVQCGVELKKIGQRLFDLEMRLGGDPDNDPPDTSIEAIRMWVAATRDAGAR